jgi:hypothetical protein
VSTTPQEPSPDATDEPILNDREHAEALRAEAEPVESDDRA